jgi:hypothetical protein
MAEETKSLDTSTQEVHLSEGRGITILPTNAAVAFKVGGLPSVVPRVSAPPPVPPSASTADGPRVASAE